MQDPQIDLATQSSQAPAGDDAEFQQQVAAEVAQYQEPSAADLDEDCQAPQQECEVDDGNNPPPTEIALVLGTLINKLTAAGHTAPEDWLGSFENPPLGSKTDTKAAIYLVNRALRLLITERRDIPEADRYGALYALVDSTELDPWIQALEAVTIPVLVKYTVGKAGLVKVDENAPTEKEVAQSVILSPEENAASQAAEAQG